MNCPITLCVTYVPPSPTPIYYDNLFNFLSNLHSISDELIILGDFNFPGIDWDTLSGYSPVSNQFCDLVFQTSLSQLINTPTHIHGNILDLLLTNLENRICHLQVHTDSYLQSDHYNITFSVATTVVTSSNPITYFTFNYSRGDYLGLHDHLLNSDFTPCYYSHNIEFIWQTIEHLLMNAMYSYIPVKKIHSDQHPTWFNPEIRHCIKRLRTLRRRYKCHPTQHISNRIASLENTLQNQIKGARQSYESHLINSYASSNNNQIFKYLKSITKSSNNIPSVMNFGSSTANTDHSKANLFNQYFHSVFHDPSTLPNIDDLPAVHNSLSSITITITDVYEALTSLDVQKSPGMDKITPRILQNCADVLCEPLHHLFTQSLRYATIPSCWKVHKVVPIYKAGDMNCVSNFRPISLLSVVSKVLERLIFTKVIIHISKSISPSQFGFTKNCSALQQMLIFTDYIINSPLQTDVIYLDISKAFDTVSHSILLTKLWLAGITGDLWTWFKNYLSNRHQSVSINNCYSDLLPVVSGVPQGSILGPLLFLVYVNDMTSYIHLSQLLKFADDTKCFTHIVSFSDHNTLQDDISALFTWSKDTDLDFNLRKFVYLSFKRIFNTTYTMSNIPIPHLDSHKDLGLILSEDLSWDKHYKFIIARAYKVLGLIRRKFIPFHSPSTLTKLYTSLVRSQLLYCSQIWRPHLMRDILNFEQIQRRATKFILNDYTSSYKSRLTKLKLFPLMYLFELQDILFAIKAIKNPTNQFNITNHIKFSSANTRSGANNKLVHPHHLNNMSRHTYFHRLPLLWNAMPTLDLNLSFPVIKYKVKQYLWNHFLTNFDDTINCTLHFLCPCSRCHQSKPPTSNLHHL